ncbi:MAG TPA: GNAT family N-acetyltransferase [Streptosporangiaceae bacterium]
MTTRPYDAADAPMLTAFMVGMGVAAGADPGLTEDNVRAWFTAGIVRDPGRDTRLVLAGDGQLAGAALLATPEGDGLRVDAFGGVLPAWRGRGLGRTLLSWQIERARELRAELAPDAPWELDADAYSTEPGAFALFEHLGMHPVRYWYEMAASLASPPGVRALPAPLRAVPFGAGLAPALYEAYTEAMADHYDFEPRGFGAWAEEELNGGTFRPDLTRIALDGGDIAAYVMVTDEPDSRVRIEGVGTRRPWRRRGLATSLLAAVMNAAAEAGKSKATLAVDSQSPTSAVTVYEALGFTVGSSWVSYRKQLSQVGEGPGDPCCGAGSRG